MKKRLPTHEELQERERNEADAKEAKNKHRSGFGKWLRSELPGQKYVAMFGDSGVEWASVNGFALKTMKKGKFKPTTISTKGLSAEVVPGEDIGSYVSGARVAGSTVAGGLLLGPLGLAGGALLGAAFKKNRNRVYVVLKYEDEVIGTLEDSAKKTPAAHKFVEALNGSANDPNNQ